MKLLGVVPCAVQIELDATDCLQLADALRYADNRDIPGNHLHIGALQTALTALAILAAHDTNTDTDTPERQLLAETRRVWGPMDTRNIPVVRAATPQD